MENALCSVHERDGFDRGVSYIVLSVMRKGLEVSVKSVKLVNGVGLKDGMGFTKSWHLSKIGNPVRDGLLGGPVLRCRLHFKAEKLNKFFEVLSCWQGKCSLS